MKYLATAWLFLPPGIFQHLCCASPSVNHIGNEYITFLHRPFVPTQNGKALWHRFERRVHAGRAYPNHSGHCRQRKEIRRPVEMAAWTYAIGWQRASECQICPESLWNFRRQMVVPRDKRRSQGKSCFYVLQYAQNLWRFCPNIMCTIYMIFRPENSPGNSQVSFCACIGVWAVHRMLAIVSADALLDAASRCA